ncbi:MAG TPA: ABC transporter permease [Cupriavidus sp.]|nr:ABC transporter permease [Cupriavidus sp.]
MTTSADLRGLFVAALKGATNAGQAVYSPFDWPTAQAAYPLILVHARKERKVSLGPNAPEFDVYTTIEIIARTKSPALVGDAGSASALAAAEVLKAQIETALINNPAIWADPAGGQRIEQFTSVDSELNTSSEGEMPMAELVMQIEVKFYQGPEIFYPIATVPLQTVNIHVDTAAPFDPNGTYANPPFPAAVNPAPRTSGPDGRDEGALNITLPQ